ncbi:fimbria/pilus periplasmic chaperone [Erwinia sp. 198]|uniref:fimbria/pilus periplasmic chaperone n=1 Tax=Erwinia sp. 198 TaxID=2022746 RepID=UPI000F676C08|nr:fimbria/pilus periplasmic chaperone [Erwinia sp. 198]RRZ88953.1 molecular chaperone [Erwinia sp. 198]
MRSYKAGLSRIAVLLTVLVAVQSHGAVSLDRTRVIFEGGQKSVSLVVSNDNKQLPYLAQGWIEDSQGKKIQQPLTALPPVQRIEPGSKSQVKIETLPSVGALPQDRETLFYFNLREIPPRSERPNTLQLALQTKVKLFYRPQALVPKRNAVPFQAQLTLTRVGDRYQVNNPTPYFVTLIDGRNAARNSGIRNFKPLMIAPKSKDVLEVSAAALGSRPLLTYINDYGARPQLQFTCSGDHCKATAVRPAG